MIVSDCLLKCFDYNFWPTQIINSMDTVDLNGVKCFDQVMEIMLGMFTAMHFMVGC